MKKPFSLRREPRHDPALAQQALRHLIDLGTSHYALVMLLIREGVITQDDLDRMKAEILAAAPTLDTVSAPSSTSTVNHEEPR